MDKQHCSLGLTTFRSLLLLRANFALLPNVFILDWAVLNSMNVFRGEQIRRFVPPDEELELSESYDFASRLGLFV